MRWCPALVAAIGMLSGPPGMTASLNPIFSYTLDGWPPLNRHTLAECGLDNPDVDGGPGTASAGCTVGADGPATTIGSAGADLAAGTLRVEAGTSSYTNNLTGETSSASTRTLASVYDTLTVTGDITSPAPILLTLSVEGRLSTIAEAPFAVNWNPRFPSFVMTRLQIWDGVPEGNQQDGILDNPVAGGWVNLRVTSLCDDPPGGGACIFRAHTPNIFGTPQVWGSLGLTTNAGPAGIFDPDDLVQITMAYVFWATAPGQSFTFLAELDAFASILYDPARAGDPSLDVAQGRIDFGNTAQLSLVVPDGVTVTSASGLFLTAVPLPPAFGLLASGLVALGARVRRRLNPMPG